MNIEKVTVNIEGRDDAGEPVTREAVFAEIESFNISAELIDITKDGDKFRSREATGVQTLELRGWRQ